MKHDMTKRLVALTLGIASCVSAIAGGPLKGRIIDKSTGEPLLGVTIQVEGTTNGTITDFDGNYEIKNTPDKEFNVVVKYVGFQTQTISCSPKQTTLDVNMESDDIAVADVTVVAQARQNTDNALLRSMKASLSVESGVSAQQISKAQDKDASEIIRRIPGISIIDDKFVMVRGLSQRYNNVWINGGAVPSSEADSRAFSFDIIPASQIDNMVIIKSPSPEYPADFSGGFIIVRTKDVPLSNSISFGVSGNYNTQTHGRDFLEGHKSPTDWLGFDNGTRMVNGGIKSTLNTIAGDGIDMQGNGFDNDWTTKTTTPVADFSANLAVNHLWEIGDRQLSLMGAVNYSNTHRRYADMRNCLFGVYDSANDKSNYLRNATDQQYNHNVRLGAMLNMAFIGESGRNRVELKNIFNQLGKSRFTSRDGITAQNDHEQTFEILYQSRMTYNGQLTGKHKLDDGKVEWGIGWAKANRNMPDRKRYQVNDKLEPGVLSLSASNDVSREFTKLNEGVGSFFANYERLLPLGSWEPTLRAGIFGEKRSRDYFTRNFYLNWNYYDNTLPENFRYLDIPTQLLVDENYGADKLYLLEEVKWRNNYEGKNRLGAAYVALNMPFGPVNVYAGLRFEANKMTLTSHRRDYEYSPKDKEYKDNDLFPSVNISYNINEKNILRLAYGKSVNRAEFREVSPSVFYDFDLASDVMGNTELTSCYVQNVDLRYEWYPSVSELVSVALFYKKFTDPIEWTYTVQGGTDLTYSYKNAVAARNYGVEIEVRKNLGFIGLDPLSLSVNASLIDSKVEFEEGSREKNRPMQGQSPYIINTGLFYTSKSEKLNIGALYNRIGKRIIGVGRSVGTTGGDDSANIPHSYEMPRNVIDLSAKYKITDHVEVNLSVRDLLGAKVNFEQQTDAIHTDGTTSEVDEVTKSYKPGTNISLGFNFKF